MGETICTERETGSDVNAVRIYLKPITDPEHIDGIATTGDSSQRRTVAIPREDERKHLGPFSGEEPPMKRA